MPEAILPIFLLERLHIVALVEQLYGACVILVLFSSFPAAKVFPRILIPKKPAISQNVFIIANEAKNQPIYFLLCFFAW